MHWLIIIFTFLFFFISSITFLRYLKLKRNKVKKRINEIQLKQWHESEETGPAFKLKDDKTKVSNFLWKNLSKLKMVRVLDERLQNEIKKANILVKSNELIMFMLLSSMLGGLTGVLISGGSLNRGLWLGLLTWTVPLIWLKKKKNKRKAKIVEQLPELISMTANSIKAGYSLIQSLELLSREMPAPMSEEIQKMLQEMRLGVTTEKALMNLNQRIESKDLDLIVTSMLIQRQVGGNLAEILDKIGDTIRERIKVEGEMKALTAQGRMSMLIFMILPLGLGAFLLMTNPDYIMTMFKDPLGWLMIAAAILGQIIGAVIIKKIIHIEV